MVYALYIAMCLVVVGIESKLETHDGASLGYSPRTHIKALMAVLSLYLGTSGSSSFEFKLSLST